MTAEFPPEVAHLPVDPQFKLPIPYIVEVEHGRANFGVLDSAKHRECYEHRLCAMCGRPMGDEVALYGDKVSLEPGGFYIEAPVHERCIEIALGGLCPFISRADYRRRRVTDDPTVVLLGDRDQLGEVGRTIGKRPAIVVITRSYRQAMMMPARMPVYLAGKPERVRYFAWVDGKATEVGELPQAREPVDPELFARTAPAFNCIAYPGEGPHYIGRGGRCQWCGEQVSGPGRLQRTQPRHTSRAGRRKR